MGQRQHHDRGVHSGDEDASCDYGECPRRGPPARGTLALGHEFSLTSQDGGRGPPPDLGGARYGPALARAAACSQRCSTRPNRQTPSAIAQTATNRPTMMKPATLMLKWAALCQKAPFRWGSGAPPTPKTHRPPHTHHPPPPR